MSVCRRVAVDTSLCREKKECAESQLSSQAA